jgi:hypothetical protein
MDLALATRLHRLAMDADEPKEIAEHVRSYQRMSRCVRQTIMLRARLRHERERHLIATTPPKTTFGRDVFPDEPDPSLIDPLAQRIDSRIMDLQEAGSRLLAQASPDLPRAERAEQLDRLDAWIDLEVERDEDFGAQHLDDHVLELCRAFDLPEALGRRFRDLPRAPRDDDEKDWGYIFDPPSQRRDTG